MKKDKIISDEELEALLDSIDNSDNAIQEHVLLLNKQLIIQQATIQSIAEMLFDKTNRISGPDGREYLSAEHLNYANFTKILDKTLKKEDYAKMLNEIDTSLKVMHVKSLNDIPDEMMDGIMKMIKGAIYE